MNYFISDTHFGHKNLIQLCDRPFDSVENMDETMISIWNRKVGKNDTVYIVGDLICKSNQSPEWYLNRLNGKKVLILGNHDDEWLQDIEPSRFFEEVARYKEILVANRPITLCHYPMLEWRNSRKVGSGKLGYLIHGHIHNLTTPLYRTLFEIGNALNAGVDINGFEPVTFEELERNNELFKLTFWSDPVSKALFLCRKYHMFQCDKAGKSYAEHPIYIASQLNDAESKIVALLHDTLEDTTLLPEVIEREFGTKILEAVQAMTHQAGEEYFDYIKRISANPIARVVKIEDLKHNMDISRLKTVADNDRKRVEKYCRALQLLGGDL